MLGSTLIFTVVRTARCKLEGALSTVWEGEVPSLSGIKKYGVPQLFWRGFLESVAFYSFACIPPYTAPARYAHWPSFFLWGLSYTRPPALSSLRSSSCGLRFQESSCQGHYSHCLPGYCGLVGGRENQARREITSRGHWPPRIYTRRGGSAMYSQAFA